MPANTCRIRRGWSLFARIPPTTPPRNTPGINNRPVLQETKSCRAYAINARTPVGGIIATKLVPWARCWLKENNNPRRGTSRTPPPMPNIPEATPQIHATTNIPVLRPIPSTTGPLLPAGNRSTFDLCFSPQQNCRQYKETAKQSLEIRGRHRQRDQTPSIGSKKNSQRAQNPCA
jgi:hypothetical protein